MQKLDAQFGDSVSFARLHLFVVSVSYCYLTVSSVFVNTSSDFDLGGGGATLIKSNKL